MKKFLFDLTPFRLALIAGGMFLTSALSFSIAHHYDGASYFYPFSDILLLALGVGSLLCSLLLGYLFLKDSTDEDFKALHWVPTELALLGVALAGIVLTEILTNLHVSIYNLSFQIIRLLFDLGLAVAALYLCGYLFMLLKRGQFRQKSWVIAHYQSLKKAYYTIRLKRRFGLIVLIYVALQFLSLGLAAFFAPLGFLLWGIITLLALIYLSRLINQMSEIKQLGDTLAKGEFDLDIKRETLKGDFLDHAEKLGNLSKAINIAIEEKTASERMKTELVTNVSHDIKTPLTSIINYSDLLSKEALQGKSQEYVDVLLRQSAKLKKLIDDLVEVSKASTGNIQVERSEIKVTELYHQLAAEYGDRFEKADLELMVRPKDVVIQADSKLIWRVIDNLMQNILKYAMPHTRVFAEVELHEKSARLTFKNVSKELLTIEPENLLQRFVRADESRSGEGSGLGLAIASSLMEIQDGSIKIETEGDLFKVYLELMRA